MFRYSYSLHHFTLTVNLTSDNWFTSSQLSAASLQKQNHFVRNDEKKQQKLQNEFTTGKAIGFNQANLALVTGKL